MEKHTLIKFDKKAYKEYIKLQKYVSKGKSAREKPTYSQLLSSINIALRNIKVNPHFGDLIPRKYLSKAIVRKFGTDKILRVELIGFWRLLYTLIGDEVKIIAFVLEFMDHNKYNKIFGYKRK